MTAIVYTPADLDTTVRTVDGEAEGEGEIGQAAVAWVIRNRAEHPSWEGTTPHDVCMKHFQFSCWNGGPDTDRILKLDPLCGRYQGIKSIVLDVFTGRWPDLTGGATEYKVTGTRASWDAAVASIPPRIIGHHSFWRLTPGGQVLPFIDEDQS